ncbi:hypothetical protein L210DRAFT_3647042 [Boletus edulis BED1]|uniref:Uncharacterized protein n=1 Tax=Boletus edulis BED1 TaxID=1328754 RepID=A0AAD4GD74_BOLED|nr:hypothetical protein L210DRAFT_3647042 [Boletus edulis BED1]
MAVHESYMIRGAHTSVLTRALPARHAAMVDSESPVHSGKFALSYSASFGTLKHSSQPRPRQTEHLDDQFMLLTAQCTSVHERRRTLRERQRKQLAALSVLVIPHPLERVEGGGCLSCGSSEEPRSRFSHSLPPSPVGIRSPELPASPPPSPPKPKSMFAKLMKALVP